MERRVILLDWLTLILAALAALVVTTDGFVLHFWSVQIRFRSVDRTLLWLAAAALLRLALDRHTLPFGATRAEIAKAWSSLTVPRGAERFRVEEPRHWGRTLLGAAAITVAVCALLHDQIAQPYSVPDLGDPLFSMWRIGWVTHQIFADPSRLFDANIFYPERLTLTLSDPMMLPAVISIPLAGLGMHPVVVYNILLISGFCLSGIAMYLLVERLTGSARAAFVAGLMFACYSYRFDHYSHLELQMTFWMPLGLLALHRFVMTGRWPYAFALALVGVAQLYSSMYYGVFFLLYAAVLGAGLVVLHRPGLRRLVLPTAAAAMLAGLMSLPLVMPFVAAQPLKPERTVGDIREFSATPGDYLRTNRHSAMWRDHLAQSTLERGLFPGVVPIVLGAIGVAPPFSALRALYVAAGLVSYDLSLGLNGSIYPYLNAWLAPVRGLRAPARFSIFVGLTLSIVSGFGALRILRWCRGQMTQQFVLGVLAVGI